MADDDDDDALVMVSIPRRNGALGGKQQLVVRGDDREYISGSERDGVCYK